MLENTRRLDWTSTTRGTDYLVLKDGSSVIAGHLIAIGEWRTDPVTVAETLLHTPYLWGGNTGFGVDCSGLDAVTDNEWRRGLRKANITVMSVKNSIARNALERLGVKGLDEILPAGLKSSDLLVKELLQSTEPGNKRMPVDRCRSMTARRLVANS